MERAEVIKGLRQALDYLNRPLEDGEGYDASADTALRAAIALLTVPSDEEIEDAQAWLRARSTGRPRVDVLLRALAALAREPGLEAEIEVLKRRVHEQSDIITCTRGQNADYSDENAALSAKLARVRAQRGALVDHAHAIPFPDGHAGDCECMTCCCIANMHNIARAYGPPQDDDSSIVKTMRVALADEATP